MGSIVAEALAFSLSTRTNRVEIKMILVPIFETKESQPLLKRNNKGDHY